MTREFIALRAKIQHVFYDPCRLIGNRSATWQHEALILMTMPSVVWEFLLGASAKSKHEIVRRQWIMDGSI